LNEVLQNYKKQRIGVLGSGQLGQMLTERAVLLGHSVHCYAPERGPIQRAGATLTQGSYEDLDSLAKFCKQIDLLTFEFENIPETCLQFLEKQEKELRIAPHPRILRTAQNRFLEKSFFQTIGCKTPAFAYLKPGEFPAQSPF